MEFCPELAIFQSSINLAERLCPNGLGNYVRDEVSSENVLQVVCQSVEEISVGLAADITAEEKDHWNLMLTALSTWKSISCVAELGITCPIPPNVVHLFRPLPSWNAAFYYDILKRNKWGNYCMRVLDVLEMSAGISLLRMILNQFNSIDALQNDDLHIASAVVKYLCLIENKYLPYLIWNTCSECTADNDRQENGRNARGSNVLLPNDQRKMLREFMRFKQTAEGNQEINTQDLAKSDESLLIFFKFIRRMLTVEEIEKLSDGERVHLLLAVLRFISLALGTGGSALQNQCLFGNSSSGPKASETSAKTRTSSLRSSCKNTNTAVLFTHEDLPLTHVKPPHSFTPNPVFMDDLIEVMSSVNECVRNFASAKEYLCQAEPHNLQPIYSVNPVLFLGSCRHIFIESYSHLQEHLQNILDAKLKEILQSFLNGLVETHIVVKDFVQGLLTHSMQPAQMFERALMKIEEKSSTAEDHFIWILEADSKDVIRDPRWLKCIEKCCSGSGFMNENLVVHALSSLSRLKHEFDKEMLKKFQLAVLEAYGNLSLDRQNVVLEEFYGKCSATPFVVDMNQFQRRFAESFRELTSADKPEFQDNMKEFSCFVLQDPFEAISTLVSSVVQNRQYGEVFVKLLRALPLMTHLESSEGHLVVIECLQGHLNSEKLSKTAKTYVLSLFRHLLSVKSVCAVRENSYLSAFSRGSLMSTALEDESEISSLVITLRSLLIAFESLDPVEVTWSLIESYAVLPLVVWLCRAVDRCRDLWPANSSAGRVVVKQTALTALNCLLVTLGRCKDEIPGHQLRWLCQQLSQVHWTVFQYVKPLLTDLPSTTHSMLPNQLNEFLCGSDQKLTESNLYMLLDVCRVSENFVQLVLNRVRPQSAIIIPLNFYQKLVYCLSGILFNSIKSEWFRIATVLNQLLVIDFAAEKLSDVNELCVCNLFVDAILIKKELNLDENCKMATWSHVVQCFSEYFKNSVLNNNFHSKDEIAFAKGCLYVVTRLWSIVPKAAAMPLSNLVLEVCTLLSNSVNTTDDHVTKALVRNAIAEVNQYNQ